MAKIDDSVLLHYSKGYDPAKAREYYLRTRELKGRPRKASEYDEELGKKYYRQLQNERAKTNTKAQDEQATRRQNNQTRRAESAEQKARRKEMEEQKAALKERLERLNDLLAELVKAAKKRSGVKVEPTKPKQDPEDTPQDKATRNETAKKDTKLTTSQKREKAEKAREEYEKEKAGPSLSTELTQLRAKVEAVKAQIEKARAEAAKNPPKQANQTARSGR